MKNNFITILALFLSISASAQKEVILTIKNMLGTNQFAFNQSSTNNLSENFNITRLDYYMSGFKIIHDGGLETAVPASKVLLVTGNANHVASLGTFNVNNVEGIKFHIGVDANTNKNIEPSIASAPLDVQNMWWGWASGYRFVALEGKGGALLNQGFEYHGLFDANYFSQTVMVNGVNGGNQVTINLDADYKEALRDINVGSGGSFHGANTSDLAVLQNFRDHVFSAGTGLPLAVSDYEKEFNISIYPNPSRGTFSFTWDNLHKNQISSATIYDVSGRVYQKISLQDKNPVHINIDKAGLYFVRINANNVNVATKKVVIQ